MHLLLQRALAALLSLIAVVQMVAKNRRLASNSRRGDDGAVTSLGNPYRRVLVRV
jgi:hypothetical protein